MCHLTPNRCNGWHAWSMSIHTEPTTDELLGLFPPGSTLDADGTLMVGGCRLDDVAAQLEAPRLAQRAHVVARARG